MSMAKSISNNKKASPKQQQKNQQNFIKETKKGKYGPVEPSSIHYVRLSAQAEPYENTQKSQLFYGVR